MKKKIAIILISAAVVASMSACGSNNKETVEEKTTVESTTEVESATEEATSDYISIADMNMDDYVTLADYKNITVNASLKAVEDDSIENYINSDLLGQIAITDRAVADGDVVTIDFVGKKDGEAFDGGSFDGFQLTIGSGQFIPGFEEGLVGVMPGETVDLDLTFPDEYPSEELKGQAVVFTVTVHNILVSKTYSEVTEEEIAMMNIGYSTKEEIWEAAKKILEEDAKKQYDNEVRMGVIQELVGNSTFTSLPEHLVEEQVKNYNEYIDSIAQAYYQMSYEEFVQAQGMDVDEYNESVKSMAEEQVKMQLVVEAVARTEGITVTDEDIRDKFADEAIEYGYSSIDEMIEIVGINSLRTDLVTERVFESIKDKIKVESVATE